MGHRNHGHKHSPWLHAVGSWTTTPPFAAALAQMSPWPQVAVLSTPICTVLVAPTWLQISAHTRGSRTAFSGNRSYWHHGRLWLQLGHGCRHGPWQPLTVVTGGSVSHPDRHEPSHDTSLGHCHGHYWTQNPCIPVALDGDTGHGQHHRL